MPAIVESMVSSTYVRDIDASRCFYGHLGFRETASGRAETSAWCYLSDGEHLILLASTTPRLDVAALPLLFYFFVDDLAAVRDALNGSGAAVTDVGRPPHARGGESKVTDPDGNTVLLGQREPAASEPQPEDPVASPQFSLLKEAAALVAAAGGIAVRCQVPHRGGRPCQEEAEIKLADSWGDSAWACMRHAEEILIGIPSVYIATRSDRDDGLTEALHRR